MRFHCRRTIKEMKTTEKKTAMKQPAVNMAVEEERRSRAWPSGDREAVPRAEEDVDVEDSENVEDSGDVSAVLVVVYVFVMMTRVDVVVRSVVERDEVVDVFRVVNLVVNLVVDLVTDMVLDVVVAVVLDVVVSSVI